MNKKKYNKILVCFGTRPEIIKLAPIIKQLQKEDLSFKTVFTGQHTDLFEDVKSLIPKPDYNLSIMRKNQDSSNILANISEIFSKIIEKEAPDLVIVQGDTSTVLACALNAFYQKIDIGHVEAGLRSFNLKSPFPEEGNRQLVSRIATFNWAPTKEAKNNLINEGISNIIITGNTIVDICKKFNHELRYDDKILITLHRSENFGQNIIKIFTEINQLALKHSNIDFIFPMHPNPNVQKHKHLLNNVRITEPLKYGELLKLLSEVRCVISDSGGIQEECASFKKKILVCRDNTERPEGIKAGFAKIIGTEVINNFNWAFNDFKWSGKNPYGDGKASEKIVDSIKS